MTLVVHHLIFHQFTAKLGAMVQATEPNRLRRFIRRAFWALAGLLVLLVAVVLIWLSGALYRHAVTFPKEEAAWKNLSALRQSPSSNAGWSEFRGIIHSHSRHSHDCEVTMEEILRVLKVDKIDFICLSDHCTGGRADFDLQWRGVHEGKLFIPGFDLKDGLMPFGVARGVVLSNQEPTALLARRIVENGGVLFFAHPEERRDWALPELSGMEIYNIHSDFKAVGLWSFLPDILINQRRFPDQVFRRVFRRPTPFLARWDELNRTRHITGIAGNDCHQNTGIRILCTATGAIRIEDTSPKTLRLFRLNWLTRPLARTLFGRIEPGRMLWHFQLDPYQRMGRFVNTHVLSHDLDEPSVLDALKAGRAFVGFDMLGDSSGFRWFATSSSGTAVMGETAVLSGDTRLRALSPLPCRFTVLKDGTLVHQAEGRELTWTPPGPGKYRVEAELKILSDWMPWVYANPIALKD